MGDEVVSYYFLLSCDRTLLVQSLQRLSPGLVFLRCFARLRSASRPRTDAKLGDLSDVPEQRLKEVQAVIKSIRDLWRKRSGALAGVSSGCNEVLVVSAIFGNGDWALLLGAWSDLRIDTLQRLSGLSRQASSFSESLSKAFWDVASCSWPLVRSLDTPRLSWLHLLTWVPWTKVSLAQLQGNEWSSEARYWTFLVVASTC